MDSNELVKLMAADVMVVGASGLVGSALLREFATHFRTVGTFCHHENKDLVHLDLRSAEQARAVMRSLRPRVVLCPAAEPDVELCEIDPVATRKVNVEGLRNLISATAQADAFFVYFSSDYVFDGKHGPYTEEDPCNPLNEYGRQKLECERMIFARLKRYIVGRIAGVYGWEERRKNFVVRLIDSLNARRPFQVPFDQIITPTYAPDLARNVRQLVESSHTGLFHLSGSLPLPRLNFALLIAEVFALDASLIKAVATSDLNLRATRPYSAGLKIEKVQGLLECPIASPLEGLKAMKRESVAELSI